MNLHAVLTEVIPTLASLIEGIGVLIILYGLRQVIVSVHYGQAESEQQPTETRIGQRRWLSVWNSNWPRKY